MMRVYIDTSAFLALMNANDINHLDAKKTWIELLDKDSDLFTSNYVLVETYALLQHRFGLEAVAVFHHDINPVLDVLWAEPESHSVAIATLLASSRRKLSLVDCLSFAAMRKYYIDTAFAFDRHFLEQGFFCLPSPRGEAELLHENFDSD
jgi:predicted nucleic acid-binding protein